MLAEYLNPMVRLGDGTFKEAFGPEATMALAFDKSAPPLALSPTGPPVWGTRLAKGSLVSVGGACFDQGNLLADQVQGLANACFVMTLGAVNLALLHHLRYVIL